MLPAVCAPLHTPFRGMQKAGNNCFMLSAVQLMIKMPVCHEKLLAYPDGDTPIQIDH